MNDGRMSFSSVVMVFPRFCTPQLMNIEAPTVTGLGIDRVRASRLKNLPRLTYLCPVTSLRLTSGSTVHLLLKAKSLTPKNEVKTAWSCRTATCAPLRSIGRGRC